MPHRWIASFEVDQRQRLILQADKLREMLGASRLIEQTVEIARELLKRPEFAGEVTIVTPVSGVLRFVADDREVLGEFLWELREGIVKGLQLPSTITISKWVEGVSFKDAVDALEDRVRLNKDGKAGVSGRPASPLFAQCSIQPQLGANRWYPDQWRGNNKNADDDPDRRRALLSNESALREEGSDQTVLQQFLSFEKLRNFRQRHQRSIWDAIPKDFSQLAPGSEDSYLAFVKADGDGMGRLLMKMEWQGAEACRQFSEAIEQCLEDATTEAVDQVTKDWTFTGANGLRFPVAPLVRAGEDYWIVCRREIAIALARALGAAYARMTESNATIRQARESVPELRDERLTLSFGILFVKQGFPFEAQLHMAEALIKNAKRYRREEKLKQGCLDFYWLESSAREDVIAHRQATQTILDDGQEMRLFTTPWSLEEAGQFEAAVRHLENGRFPSRKLKQLETIVRLGSEFSKLAYEQWQTTLLRAEVDLLKEVNSLLPERLRMPKNDLFQNGRTPLLDLLKLAEARAVRKG